MLEELVVELEEVTVAVAALTYPEESRQVAVEVLPRVNLEVREDSRNP